jgi:hypothetical protein
VSAGSNPAEGTKFECLIEDSIAILPTLTRRISNGPDGPNGGNAWYTAPFPLTARTVPPDGERT